MRYRVRFLLLFLPACVAFPERSPAPVVFRPGEKVKYHAPGVEEISGTADQLFSQAQAEEQAGERKQAIKTYKRLVKRYPRSNHSAEATYRAGQLTEAEGKLIKAAAIYRGLIEAYPETPRYHEAIEAQFRIGEIVLNAKKKKILGIPMGSALEEAVEIFASIVRNAPYGHITARAQFDIGRAREKQGSPDLAIEAYQSVVEKFPNDPLAVDAQYQIGYLWFSATRAGTYDPEAPARARVAFQDFLYRYPKSEKATQARENMALIETRETKGSLQIAQYYDKAKKYRAAVIYYNEVIRQQPGSAESEIARKRIAQLRAKVGDAALQSAATVAERNAKNNPKKTAAREPSSTSPESESGPVPPELRGSARDLAPLPVDSDSLPPPSAPDGSAPFDSTAAPDSSATPEATTAPEPPATPEATAAPEPSATPEATAAP